MSLDETPTSDPRPTDPVSGQSRETRSTTDPSPQETDSITGRIDAARTRWHQAIGERGTHPCPHCDETFTRPGYLVLHLGRRHDERLNPGQREEYLSAESAERGVMDEIALHTKSGLFALPLLLVWAATLVLLIEMDANVAWIVLSTPGYALFAGLVYVMAYGYQTGGREDYYGRS